MKDMRFLQIFQENKHLGRDALKFTKTFSVSVVHDDVTKIATKEDWFPMGAILEHYGSKVSDYKDMEAALTAVRHLCAKNQQEHGYTPKKEDIDEQFPQFSKFWFIFSLGKKEVHEQKQSKQLEGYTDVNSKAEVDKAKLFMEGLGYQESGCSSTPGGEASVKIEHEKYQALCKNLELLKFSYQLTH